MSVPAAVFTVFQGFHRIASGVRAQAEQAVRAAHAAGTPDVLMFEDATGKVVDVDLREPLAEADLASPDAQETPRGRGRPRLGVVAREITLLPRHWDWLAAQPGGASVALRRLVDEARRAGAGPQQARAAREAAYAVMSALGGNLPGFEEASRALFANDRTGLEAHLVSWPADVRAYVLRLADGPELAPATEDAR